MILWVNCLELVNGVEMNDDSSVFNRRCVHIKTGVEYAVKVLSRRRVDCSQEVQLLTMCQGHPNVVRLHEVFHDDVRC